MEELHDAQIEEMNKRLDAEEAGMSEDIPDSQSSVPAEMTGESQLSTQPTVARSMRTISNRTDNTDTTVDTGMELDFDDDEPLPDIVRYKIGSGVRKDQV